MIYVGSFSKYLAPGLRIGFLVGAEPLIHEARQLRRLILRQPPTNNQRTVGLFIAGGYYDALVSRLQRAYRGRWQTMNEALAEYMPEATHTPSGGGTSFWIEGPKGLDADVLARNALTEGLVIEPGSIHFLSSRPPRNFFRLGFSSIREDKIRPERPPPACTSGAIRVLEFGARPGRPAGQQGGRLGHEGPVRHRRRGACRARRGAGADGAGSTGRIDAAHRLASAILCTRFWPAPPRALNLPADTLAMEGRAWAKARCLRFRSTTSVRG